MLLQFRNYQTDGNQVFVLGNCVKNYLWKYFTSYSNLWAPFLWKICQNWSRAFWITSSWTSARKKFMHPNIFRGFDNTTTFVEDRKSEKTNHAFVPKKTERFQEKMKVHEFKKWTGSSKLRSLRSSKIKVQLSTIEKSRTFDLGDLKTALSWDRFQVSGCKIMRS